jgi:hypothetical protein
VKEARQAEFLVQWGPLSGTLSSASESRPSRCKHALLPGSLATAHEAGLLASELDLPPTAEEREQQVALAEFVARLADRG